MEKLQLKIVKNTKMLNESLEIRKLVFIKEQNVDESLEIDQYDNLNNPNVKHFILYLQGNPIGTLRVLNNSDYLKIGRVAILKDYRKNNFGLYLINKTLEKIENDNIFNIKDKYFYLESQIHAISFYEKLGFEAYGEEFVDANIKHRKMVRK